MLTFNGNTSEFKIEVNFADRDTIEVITYTEYKVEHTSSYSTDELYVDELTATQNHGLHLFRTRYYQELELLKPLYQIGSFGGLAGYSHVSNEKILYGYNMALNLVYENCTNLARSNAIAYINSINVKNKFELYDEV